MAILNVNFMSTSLMRTVDMTVILPVDKMALPGMPVREARPLKTLYLLHGILGDHNDWVKGTRIALWAEENNLAVVMPSGENQFYVNHNCPGFAYGDLVGKELVEITRKMFPLSKKREDTFIGGLSMGGYGALYNGISNNRTFGAVVALSSALVTDKARIATYDNPYIAENRYYLERCFGDLAKLSNTDLHLPILVERKLAERSVMPDIYMACGEDDFLLPANEAFAEYLKNQGMEVTFEVGPGNHEWNFWDTYLKKGLEWLPLEDADMGIHSGNIGE